MFEGGSGEVSWWFEEGPKLERGEIIDRRRIWEREKREKRIGEMKWKFGKLVFIFSLLCVGSATRGALMTT